MKTRTRRSLALLSVLTLFGCDPTRAEEPDPVVDVGGTAGDEEEDEGPLPDLPNLADLSPGTYLFPTDALGAGETYLRSAQLIGTDADAFVIAIDDAPHRRVARRDAWPMACLTRAARFSEGDLRVTLDAGAPVFVLASSTEAARVSVALDTEHSVVVPRSALAFDACAWPDAGEAERRVPRAPEGDAVCLFADQESIDGTAGLVVPTGAPLALLEADGDWARARVSWPGGRVEGWVDATLPRGETERPDWLAAALARGFCLYPGRPTGRPWAGAGPEAGDPFSGEGFWRLNETVDPALRRRSRLPPPESERYPTAELLSAALCVLLTLGTCHEPLRRLRRAVTASPEACLSKRVRACAQQRKARH